MVDYPSNSYKSREAKKKEAERPEIKKVVSGAVKTKKKSEVRKLYDVFISEDASTVKDYIIYDVIIPNARNLIVDIITDTAHIVFGGGRRRTNGQTAFSKTSYISYDKFSDRRSSSRYDEPRRPGINYDDIILETRSDAEEVLDQMNALIETYDKVSIADMYDLIGKTAEYTHNKYGWTNLSNARPVRCRDGYMLELPKAMPLKD